MSLQPLEAPSDAFLRQGSPAERFLTEGPQPTPAVVDEDHRQAVVAIAGAFLAWRLFFVEQAKKELPTPPTEPISALDWVWQRKAPFWLKLMVPSIAEAMRPQQLTGEELEAAAVDYATSLGSYIHRTSAEAVVAGYQEGLRRGVSPTMAWLRALEGYGMTEKRLRSWVAQQAQSAIPDLVGPSARRALDRAILARADVLGQTEGWHARQVAKSVVWMYQDSLGLMPGARKRWLTRDDELVCRICGPLHRKEAGLREQFVLPNGERLWAPGVHPNCRCELELVMPMTTFEKAWDETRHPRDGSGRFTYMRATHKQVVRRTPQGRQVLLDEGMSELVPALWAHGLETKYSCQGPGDKAIDELADNEGINAYVWITNAERWDALKKRLGKAAVLTRIREEREGNGVTLRMETRDIEPLRRAVSGLVEKNAPGDPYDRDGHGRFARQESRQRKVARPLPTKEREVDPVVADLFAQMTEAPVEPAPAEPDPFAPDPFARAGDPFGGVDPFAPDPFGKDPFATDPFASDPFGKPGEDPYAGKKTGRRRRLYVIVNGQLQATDADEVSFKGDPDHFVFVGADEFFALPRYNIGHGYVIDLRNEPGEPVDIHETDLAVGATVDFDEYAEQAAWREARQTHSGLDVAGKALPIEARVQRSGEGLTDLFSKLGEFYTWADDDVDERLLQSVWEAENNALEYATSDPAYFQEMPDEQVVLIYAEAGMLPTLRAHHNLDQLREDLSLLMESNDYDEDRYTPTQANALQDAAYQWIIDHDDDVQAEVELVEQTRAGYLRVPPIFTFKDNDARLYVPEDGKPRIVGRYRVVANKIHSLHQGDGSRAETGNPRIRAWREVVLEPMDDDEVG